MGHYNMLCMYHEVYQQLVVIFVVTSRICITVLPPITGHNCNGTNMASESGFRHRDYQNVFRVTDVKERKKLLGKVLQIPELNEEGDWRPGILLRRYSLYL